MKVILVVTLFVFSLGLSDSVQVNNGDETVTSTYVIGELVALDTPNNQLKLKTSAGQFTVLLNDKTRYMQLAPGETSLAKSEPVELAKLTVGDRIMARGRVVVEQLSVTATHVIVMKKDDITRRREREREEWRRGVVGRVTAVRPAAKEVVLAVRSNDGERTVVVSAGDKVPVRRYEPDAVKPGEAQTGVFNELKVGDVVRARGSSSADGKVFLPDEIITGTFQMAGGKITSLNPGKREIVIDNILTKRPLTIVVTPDSMLRRILPQHATMLLANGKTEKAATGNRDSAQEVVDRLPPMGLNELKVGDMILASSTVGNNASRATAIVLAGGAEAIISAAQKAQAQGNKGGTNASLGLSSSALDGAIGIP